MGPFPLGAQACGAIAKVARRRVPPHAAARGNARDRFMKFGASMFFTDYSMGAAELAVPLEAPGFHLGLAPEHSPIPPLPKAGFISGCRPPKQYYDSHGPVR